jgi:hypothetical protein
MLSPGFGPSNEGSSEHSGAWKPAQNNTVITSVLTHLRAEASRGHVTGHVL